MELDVAPPFKTAGAPAVETGFGAVVLPGTVAGDVTVGVAVDVMLLLADEVGAGAGVELDSPLLLLVLVVLDVSVEVLAPEDEEVRISEELREEKVLSEKPEEDIPSVGLEVEEAVLSEELIGVVASEELEEEEVEEGDVLLDELEVEEDEDVPSEELEEDVLSDVEDVPSDVEDVLSDVEDELSGVEDDVAEKVGVFETTPVEVFGGAPLPVDPLGVLVTSFSGALWLEETGVGLCTSQ